MSVITASVKGGKWSETAAWEGAKVPGEGDDVILASTSGSLEISAESFCRSIDCTNYKKTLTVKGKLKIGTSTSNSGLALKFGVGMILAGSTAITFKSTSGTIEKISFAGLTYKGNLLFEGTGGKWELAEPLSISSANLQVLKGELKTNGEEVHVESIVVEGGTLNAEKSTVTCSGFWDFVSGSLKLAESVLIVAGNFEGSSVSYATVELTSLGTTNGSNTYVNLILATSGKIRKFNKATKQTITGSVTAPGAKAGSLVKLESNEAGKAWEFSKSSGIISLDFLELKDSHAVGGAEWYAGANSTNVSGNEGWKFEAPPSNNVAMIV